MSAVASGLPSKRLIVGRTSPAYLDPSRTVSERLMHLFVGTSGYSYKEWKGSFYPEKFPPKKMLGYYAERLSTVEINATFRRMPTEKLLTSWKEQTPASFRFALKAPQAITHFKRLKDVGIRNGVFPAYGDDDGGPARSRPVSDAAQHEEGHPPPG